MKVAVFTLLSTKSISSSIEYNIFSDLAKTALVVPLDKGKPNKNDIGHFRPMSILNTFSKNYERVINNQLLHGMENVFSERISAYRKSPAFYVNILIRLIEEWREYLDKSFFVGAVITDFSKAFDCFLHYLLIAKLEAYGLGEKALSYIFLYLTNRNQCDLVNDKKSDFQKIVSGVPQGSITGPILFNFSTNYLFVFVSSAWMHKFAEDILYLLPERLLQN